MRIDVLRPVQGSDTFVFVHAVKNSGRAGGTCPVSRRGPPRAETRGLPPTFRFAQLRRAGGHPFSTQSGWGGSNSRPHAPNACALPTALQPDWKLKYFYTSTFTPPQADGKHLSLDRRKPKASPRTEIQFTKKLLRAGGGAHACALANCATARS